ncbi:MAG TPA: hypothetical protein VLV89_06690, partial [Candidatus Acidoferrum sp.]|nr:hypothetical protein [Candidatus Acidoferrum sp.]
MLRRATLVIFIIAMAGLVVSADDFWVKKDWRAWSQTDCESMLGDSPWAKRINPNEQNKVGDINGAL